MKKSVLMLGVICTLSVTAFAFMGWQTKDPTIVAASCHPPADDANAALSAVPNLVMLPDPAIAQEELVYTFAPRFSNLVTWEKLASAETIIDILPEGAADELQDFNTVTVSLLYPEGQFVNSEVGAGIELNEAQRKLIKTARYETNLHIHAMCQHSNPWNDMLAPYELTYYMSIVPQQTASAPEGNTTMAHRLREQSREFTRNLRQDQLQPARIAFTVTREGAIRNVVQQSGSGYPDVDEKLMKLIMEMPAWTPARDASGQPVDQQLVFFFGSMGC